MPPTISITAKRMRKALPISVRENIVDKCGECDADGRLLASPARAGFQDQHAREEPVGEHALGECGVVVVRDRRAEEHQAGLVDDAGLVLPGLAAHRKDRVGRRVHRQQRPHRAFVASVLGLIDRLEHAVDLVGLKQHAW